MENNKETKFYQKAWFIWLMLILIAPVGVILLWKNKKYNKFARISISVMFSFIFLMEIAGICSGGYNSNINSPTAVSSNTNNAKASSKVTQNRDTDKKSANARLYKEIVPLIKDSCPKLQQKSYDFLVNNNNLFPAQSNDDKTKLNALIDSSIEYKHLDKNIDDYLEKVISVNGTIVSINEEKIENQTVSILHIMNNNGDSFQVIYLGKLDMYENDSVKCIGLPVAMNCFANVSGGTTNVALIIGGYIQKI